MRTKIIISKSIQNSAADSADYYLIDDVPANVEIPDFDSVYLTEVLKNGLEKDFISHVGGLRKFINTQVENITEKSKEREALFMFVDTLIRTWTFKKSSYFTNRIIDCLVEEIQKNTNDNSFAKDDLITLGFDYESTIRKYEDMDALALVNAKYSTLQTLWTYLYPTKENPYTTFDDNLFIQEAEPLFQKMSFVMKGYVRNILNKELRNDIRFDSKQAIMNSMYLWISKDTKEHNYFDRYLHEIKKHFEDISGKKMESILKLETEYRVSIKKAAEVSSEMKRSVLMAFWDDLFPGHECPYDDEGNIIPGKEIIELPF
jgi:hypothetical protein